MASPCQRHTPETLVITTPGKKDTNNKNNSFLEEEAISGLRGKGGQSLGRRSREGLGSSNARASHQLCDPGHL